jgi:hypothetical protein
LLGVRHALAVHANERVRKFLPGGNLFGIGKLPASGQRHERTHDEDQSGNGWHGSRLRKVQFWNANAE